MRSYKVHGFILKRTNLGEADKLVTVLSSELGKIKVLAKGIRRIKSRRAAHLELFNYVDLTLHESKSFFTATEVKTIESFPSLKQDLRLTGYLFYLSEVLDKILPEHVPHPELIPMLLTTLPNLNESQVKEFGVQLLWNLGYLPHGEYPKLGVTNFIETVIEKRIRSKKFLEEI